MTDLVVAGGGPAGLATALYAARAGLAVVVREPRDGAIDKACGEGLMPGAVAALAALDIDPPGRPLEGIRYVSAGRSVAAPFRDGPGRGVRRTALSEAFRSAVADAGITVEHRPVTEVSTDEGGVTVDGTRASYLVAADGLHSPLRRWAGLEGAPVSYRRFGQRVHFAHAPWTPYVEVHWADDAEAYVTPVGDELVGVAVLSSARRPFDQHLAQFPALEARFAGAERASSVRGAGPLRQRATGRVAGRLLLVGDAAGYVDALTGEGVALALAQARAAVDAILAGDPGRYEKEWHTVTRRYRLLTASLVGATRLRPLRRAVVPAADRLPRVFSAAVQTLASPA